SGWATLSQLGRTENMYLGRIAILHTWRQNLSLRPLILCIVPGGGIDVNGRWKRKIKTGKYLICVKALNKAYVANLVEAIRTEQLANQQLYDQLFAKNWVVYTKQPFGGPKQVIEYLGRYTHKVAISNHRIKNVTNHEVTISYKDYNDNSKTNRLT